MLKLSLILSAALLTGCAVASVRFNDGQRVALHADNFVSVESLQPQADDLCRRAGKASARHVTSTDAGPAWWPTSARMHTFECR